MAGSLSDYDAWWWEAFGRHAADGAAGSIADVHKEIDQHADAAADALTDELWDRADYLGDLGLPTTREGERAIARDRLRAHFAIAVDEATNHLETMIRIYRAQIGHLVYALNDARSAAGAWQDAYYQERARSRTLEGERDELANYIVKRRA